MKKTKTATKTGRRTIVTFLLDRTGSMLEVLDATIEGFNAYLSKLKEDGGKIDFTSLQFDSISLDKLHVAEPVKNVPPLTRDTFVPRGSTPLIDACVKTIKAVEAALLTRDDDPKVVVCFQTDGRENCSVDYKPYAAMTSAERDRASAEGRPDGWLYLNQLIKQKTSEGWQFNFMGCGIDAYQQSAMMGISVGSTVSYGKDRGATRSAFADTASNTSLYAAGATMNTAYTSAQKSAAGDIFDSAKPAPLLGNVVADPIVNTVVKPTSTVKTLVEDFKL